ncbi:MAG: DUF305 domain-containing protein [Pseudomonadota bacterium]
MSTASMPSSERRRAERRQSSQPAQAHHRDEAQGGHSMKMASYGRFVAMVAASTALGFVAMYLNVLEWDHVFFSWMRLFMAMIMGGVMTAIMMLFMWGMYPNKKANWGLMGAAVVLFLAGLALARTQATIGDVAYMKAMIPHHSIAILTSSRAKIEDPRVRKLADGIIEAQKREIAEMKKLVDDLQQRQ